MKVTIARVLATTDSENCHNIVWDRFSRGGGVFLSVAFCEQNSVQLKKTSRVSPKSPVPSMYQKYCYLNDKTRCLFPHPKDGRLTGLGYTCSLPVSVGWLELGSRSLIGQKETLYE